MKTIIQKVSFILVLVHGSIGLAQTAAHVVVPPASTELSVADVARKLHGGTPLAPNSKSALGKFIAKTGAKTVVRRFPSAPEGSTLPLRVMGPKKLVVSVDEDSFEAFKKAFSSKHFLYLYYIPNGGMIAAYKGKYGNGQLREDMVFNVPGTMLVPILLSSSEAKRLENYFELAELNYDYAARPYHLKSSSGAVYCSSNAFEGCTNWFGQLPIGDKRVNAYVNPSGDDDGKHPYADPLVKYSLKNYPEEAKALIQKVWRVPGYQQLGEMLNPNANRRGEFANAGWIAYTLLGSKLLKAEGEVERVPVVFLLTDDRTKALDPNFSLKISSY